MQYKKNFIPSDEAVKMFKSTAYDGYDAHSHEFIELVYVSSGQGLHHIRGKTYRVSAGDLFIIRTSDEHSLVPLPDAAGTFQWLNCVFLPSFTTFDLTIFPPENKYIGSEGFDMSFLFQSMMREYAAKEPGYLEALASYLNVVLIRLSRLLDISEQAELYPQRKKQADLKRAVAYLHRYYAEDIRLDVLASHLGVSVSYTGKLFKELLNESPIAYLNRYRLEASCKLLLGSTLSVSQICQEAGFKDTKFYYSQFKKKMGLTPGQFREKYTSFAEQTTSLQKPER